MNRIMLIVASSLIAITLGGCVPNINHPNYHAWEVGRASCVKHGVVICRRNVVVDANSQTGAFAGSLVGAVAGSNLGGCGVAGAIGTLAGAVVGGVVGNAIEQDVNRQPAFEYLIRLDNGDTISVVQGTNIRLRVNEPVFVKFGRITRVVPECMYPSC